MDDKEKDKRLKGLKSAIAFMVRATMAGYSPIWGESREGTIAKFTLSVNVNTDSDSIPNLDTAQIMGLNTLVRDEAQLPQALADFLQDTGTDPESRGWSDFLREIPPRAKRAILSSGADSFAELTSEERDARGRYKVDPSDWRNFGETTCRQMVRAMKKYGIPLPAHWHRELNPNWLTV